MSGKVKFVVIAVIGLLLVSVGVAVFALMGNQSSKPEAESGSTVRIEIRGMPQMTIKKDGKTMGKTPVSFVVPRSTKPIRIDADWIDQRIYKAGERLLARHAMKEVIPDRSQTIDITRKDADPVKEGGPTTIE
jgi:hypothetical protein